MKRVAILGATGSIGAQALDVAADHPGLQVVALAASARTRRSSRPRTRTGRSTSRSATRRRRRGRATVFDGHVHEGPQAAVELVRAAGADVVLNAIVGAAGLEASLAALECGADLALANKESLVAGGPLVLETLRRSGRRLLPVDSEHSALQQCLGSEPRDALAGLVLTASGGPVPRPHARGAGRGRRSDDALAHPTWAMGAKITVDSATLMNKGLEVIEAHVLFDLPYDRIEVVVHPQSIVHGMARFRDGALLAHVGHPDMRVPDLLRPDLSRRAPRPPHRASTSTARSRWTSSRRTPRPSAASRWPAPRARRAAPAPCILNAANEEAVAAFLAGRIGFLDIDALVADALDRVRGPPPVDDLDAVRAADAAAAAAVPSRLRSGGRVSIALVLLGLLFLILVHELGHFIVAKAVGAKATKFYVGFPPPLIRRQHGETEYGIGAIPLGGYVPHRRHDAAAGERPVEGERRRRGGGASPAAPRTTTASAHPSACCASGWTPASSIMPTRRPRRALATLEDDRELLDPRTAAEARKDLTRLAEEADPRAYWRLPVWKRISIIAAGPAANLLTALDHPHGLLHGRHADHGPQLAGRVGQRRLAGAGVGAAVGRPHRRGQRRPS